MLNATECTQPAMLTAGVATYRLWRERGGIKPAMMAGHSLGEFSALVAAECLDFKSGRGLVRYRGELMQAAVPQRRRRHGRHLGTRGCGCRSGLPGSLAGRGGGGGQFQCPRAGGDCRTRDSGGARHRDGDGTRGAPRAGAAHQRSGAQLAHGSRRPSGCGCGWRARRWRQRAGIAVYGVDVKTHTSADDIRAGLVKQLHTPVYWAATVRTMISAGATADHRMRSRVKCSRR